MTIVYAELPRTECPGVREYRLSVRATDPDCAGVREKRVRVEATDGDLPGVLCGDRCLLDGIDSMP